MKYLGKSKVFLLLISTFYFATSLSIAQSSDKVIATIDGQPIYLSEVKKRYEFLPQIGRETFKNLTPLKEEILYTIIAERLWANEAKNTGIGNNELLRSTLSSVEKLLLRDALYNSEVKNKLVFTDKEIVAGIEKKSKQIQINYLYSENEEEMFTLLKFLNNGFPFDTLLSTRAEAAYQNKSIKVEYGNYDETTENILFGLSPGEYTNPIKMEDGWYIYFVREINILPLDYSLDSVEDVKKVLASRATTSRLAQYYESFFKNKEAKTNGKLFKILLEELKNLYKLKLDKYAGESQPDHIYYNNYDLIYLEAQLGDDVINQTFIDLGTRDLTLQQSLSELVFNGLKFPVNDSISMASRLNGQVKSLIEKEYLADEAYQKGLLSDPEVQKSLDMWNSFYCGNAYKNNLYRRLSPDDKSLKEFYNKGKSKRSNDVFEKPFEEVKDTLKDIFAGEYKNKEMIKNTVDLANTHDIEIDLDLLESAEFTNLNMIVYRYFGFGGKMLAAPMAPPFAEWYKQWKQQKNKKVF